MVAVAFPNLKPSSRNYSPGSFPQTEFRAQNGALTILRYGNKRVDSTLSLEFRNITDASAALILQNYEQVNGTLNNVTFTQSDVTVNTSNPYRAFVNESTSGLRWRYASPPEVTSSVRNRVNVRCEFIGNLLSG